MVCTFLTWKSALRHNGVHFFEVAMSKNCTPLWREARFQHTILGPFWKLRCRKSARRCGTKHIWKSKCTKHLSSGPLLEVAMSKKCTSLWREAHFQVKMYKTHHALTTFEISDVSSLRFTTIDDITLYNAPLSLHSLTLQLLQRNYTPLHSTTLNYTTLHYTTLHSITLHYTTLHYTTRHYTTLHYLPLHLTTLHYITLHYTTLHYTTTTTAQLHCTTIHYTTLHYLPLHLTTLHYITLHYTPLHYNYTTTLHYTPLH